MNRFFEPVHWHKLSERSSLRKRKRKDFPDYNRLLNFYNMTDTWNGVAKKLHLKIHIGVISLQWNSSSSLFQVNVIYRMVHKKPVKCRSHPIVSRCMYKHLRSAGFSYKFPQSSSAVLNLHLLSPGEGRSLVIALNTSPGTEDLAVAAQTSNKLLCSRWAEEAGAS